MTSKAPEGCTSPAAGPLVPEAENPTEQATREETMQVRIGQQAPDFEATAYFKGTFTKVKLSDYRGKWVLLCFYPGDFTFV